MLAACPKKLYLDDPSLVVTDRQVHQPLNNTLRARKYWAVNNTDNDWTKREFTLNLCDVTYSISERQGHWWQGGCCRPKKTKRILNNITCQFKSGEITAILGSSGSGKTSLLDVIACRSDGRVKGKITLNNFECSRNFIKDNLSYVIQADRLLHALTVRETLSYAAFLRLPGTMSQHHRQNMVNNVIQKMGLKSVADSRIGGLIDRGISGGERRRVTIAIQLLRDPSVILLDEPTTGLDSYTARHLVANLAELAHQGKIVIMAIHQPRSDIFKLLDNVMILSSGDVVYSGSKDRLVPYFTELGHPCSTYANPLDFYIDLTSIDVRAPGREQYTTERLKKLKEVYTKSADFAKISEKVRQFTDRSHKDIDSMAVRKPSPPNVFRVLCLLIGRMMRFTGRDRTVYLSRAILLVACFPILACFIFRMKNDQQSAQNRVGVIYQAMSIPAYCGIMHGFYLFPVLREVYYRERLDGLYSTPTFILAYSIYILPFHIFSCFLFASAVYWITGLQASWAKFGIFNGTLTALSFIYEIMTIGTQGAIFDPRIALNTVTIMLVFAVTISSGLIRRVEAMMSFLQWISYAWVFKYASPLLIENEFSGLNLTCSSATACQYRTGDDFLKMFFPDAKENRTLNGAMLGAFFVFFICTTMLTYSIRGLRTLH